MKKKRKKEKKTKKKKKKKKKKYVRAPAEVERDALAWATKVLREKRAELEKGYLEAHSGEATDTMIEFLDHSSRSGTTCAAYLPRFDAVRREPRRLNMMTLGNMRENGVRSLWVRCGALGCYHER
jgi:hypothetical protein